MAPDKPARRRSALAPVPVKPWRKPKPKARPPRTMKVMLLETHLDTDLGSDRTQSVFLREFFDNFGDLEFVAKQIHSRADLEKFLDVARGRNRIDVVHIVAHGKAGRRGTTIGLTGGESLDLRRGDVQRLFEGLRVDALFLSCCQLGEERRLMRQLQRTSGVGAVFSYADDITDYQAFLIEAIFYHLTCGYYRGVRSDLNWREIYQRLTFGVDYLGVDDGKHPLVEPLLVAAFADEK
jgi:hypothetical protein